MGRGGICRDPSRSKDALRMTARTDIHRSFGFAQDRLFDCLAHDEAVSHSAQDDSFWVVVRRTGNGEEQATAKYRDSGFARMTNLNCISRFLRYATE